MSEKMKVCGKCGGYGLRFYRGGKCGNCKDCNGQGLVYPKGKQPLEVSKTMKIKGKTYEQLAFII